LPSPFLSNQETGSASFRLEFTRSVIFFPFLLRKDENDCCWCELLVLLIFPLILHKSEQILYRADQQPIREAHAFPVSHLGSEGGMFTFILIFLNILL